MNIDQRRCDPLKREIITAFFFGKIAFDDMIVRSDSEVGLRKIDNSLITLMAISVYIGLMGII